MKKLLILLITVLICSGVYAQLTTIELMQAPGKVFIMDDVLVEIRLPTLTGRTEEVTICFPVQLCNEYLINELQSAFIVAETTLRSSSTYSIGTLCAVVKKCNLLNKYLKLSNVSIEGQTEITYYTSDSACLERYGLTIKMMDYVLLHYPDLVTQVLAQDDVFGETFRDALLQRIMDESIEIAPVMPMLTPDQMHFDQMVIKDTKSIKKRI